MDKRGATTVTTTDVSRTAKFSQAVSTSIFQGVSDADCLRQAEADVAEGRRLGYEPQSQSWGDDAGLRVLTVSYLRTHGSVQSVAPPAVSPAKTGGLSGPVRILLGVGSVLLLLLAIGSFAKPGGASLAPLLGGGVDTVRVQYAGCWTGSILGVSGTTQKSVDGCNNQSFPVAGSIVSVVFQKKDDSAKQLTVQLLNGSSVVVSESTTAAYGIASAAH